MLGELKFENGKAMYGVPNVAIEDTSKKIAVFIAETDEKLILEYLAKHDRDALVKLHRTISKLLVEDMPHVVDHKAPRCCGDCGSPIAECECN